MNTTHCSMWWMIAFVALWASVEALAGWLSRPYSPYQVVWSRYGSQLAIMPAIWGWRDPLVLVRTMRPVMQVTRSLLMLVMPAAWILSLQRGLKPDSGLAIFGLAPLIICVLTVLLLKERPRPGVWVLAALVSAAALFCLSLRVIPSFTAVAAAVSSAGSFQPLCRDDAHAAQRERAYELFYPALGVFVVLTLFIPMVWITPSSHDAVVMFLIGALGLLAVLAIDRMAVTAPLSSRCAMVDRGMVVVMTIAMVMLDALCLVRHLSVSAQ